MIAPLNAAEQVMETERLRLTPMTLDDLDIAVELLGDIRVMRYVSGEIETSEDVRAQMPNYVRKGAGGRIGIWMISLKSTGEKIGDTVLLPLTIDADDTEWEKIVPDRFPEGDIEVGYLLKPAAWGRGYATEVCRRMLRFGFEKTHLEVIHGVTEAENLASQNVLRKCGMTYLGSRRAYAVDNNASFGITREEWRAMTGG